MKKITWENVEEYITGLKKFIEGAKPNGVYGFARGGLVLAVMISHRFKIPMLIAPTEGCLIVDDICDSGETLLHYRTNSSALNKPRYIVSTMMYKPNTNVMVDYYWGLKDDEWVVFPWEER